MKSILSVALLGCMLPSYAADQLVPSDKFMREEPVGALGLVYDPKAEKISHAKRFLVLEPDKIVESDRKKRTCIVGINHRDDQRSGDAFVAVQIISFFKNEPASPNSVNVYRNPGWRSLSSGSEMGAQRAVPLRSTSVSEFATLHNSSIEDKSMLVGTQREVEWHAKVDASNSDDSSSFAKLHREFWAENPLLIPAIKNFHMKNMEGLDYRVSNRLIKFQYTAGYSVDRMPNVEIYCPNTIQSVAIRVYRPSNENPYSIGHIKFR